MNFMLLNLKYSKVGININININIKIANMPYSLNKYIVKLVNHIKFK